jgi:hypothetical protein
VVNFSEFATDTGYIKDYSYKKKGFYANFVLNEFEDIKALIPKEKLKSIYKAKVIIFQYLRPVYFDFFLNILIGN